MARAVRVKEDIRRFLADVPEEYVFWCNDGRAFKNLRELRDGLNTMTDETFAYHVNMEKNDFSNWIRDIIKDEQLAKDISKTMSRREMANIVSRRIASLSR
jgi:CRISPR/Cas system type I-B associated protein Csh2 (Cas7 group RAMP superfamily)